MKHLQRKSRSAGALTAAAAALGSFALGAFAVGALAIGALAIRKLVIGQAHMDKLHIRDLQVDRLTVHELTIEKNNLSDPSTHPFALAHQWFGFAIGCNSVKIHSRRPDHPVHVNEAIVCPFAGELFG